VIVRPLAALVAALGAVATGIGWLYVMRNAGLLTAGPQVPEALPLQRLAGGSTEPLARLVVAWLPAGLVCGLVLAAVGFRRVIRAALMFTTTAILLLALGAAADAVTANEPIRSHVSEQPGRLATWVAAGLVALGAALVPGRRRA
jgi:hypothetical protein